MSEGIAVQRWLGTAALALAAVPATAGSLTLQLTLPEIHTASYYRPYVAAWVEKAEEKSVVGTVAVWYDTQLRDGLGKSWLRQLRTWWRNGGDQLALPVDGVSGATRPAGTHTLQLAEGKGALAQLPPGRYQIAIEAAREQGDRELLRVPFEWRGAANAAHAEGTKELGKVTVTVHP
ncbi:MAG: DUF2271 domain-containing protein [Variovorax sp.]|nr:MAG: DUF2271 domain-containing protein [Variovorax sp.]